jgi:uncharacterized protein YqgC (DUF456 family)
MDIALTIIGGLLVLAGLVGCFVPVLIGPPLGFAGILCLHFTKFAQFPLWSIIVLGLLAGFASVLDNILPMLGAKRTGGSKRAVAGSVLGTLIGMFVFPPFGLLVGAFAGALIGELSTGRSAGPSLKTSLGTLLGFVAGTAFKVFVSGLMVFLFVAALIRR